MGWSRPLPPAPLTQPILFKGINLYYMVQDTHLFLGGRGNILEEFFKAMQYILCDILKGRGGGRMCHFQKPTQLFTAIRFGMVVAFKKIIKNCEETVSKQPLKLFLKSVDNWRFSVVAAVSKLNF